MSLPWITGSIETKFVFRQGDDGKQVAEAEHAAEASGGLTIDEVLWSFISDSQNPEDFERFVKVFPNSRYAAEATEKSRVKVAALTERGLYINGNLVSTSIAAAAPVVARPFQCQDDDKIRPRHDGRRAQRTGGGNPNDGRPRGQDGKGVQDMRLFVPKRRKTGQMIGFRSQA